MNTVKCEEFEVRFSWDGDVLVARVEGPHDSFHISLEYWKEIARERVRVGARRVLVLENLEETGEPEMVLELTEHLVSLDFQGAKVAFVDRVDFHREEQEQIILIARERGIQAGVFSDEQQAMTWLRHGED